MNDASDTTRSDDGPQYRPTLGDLNHSNPRTGEQFGDAMVYRRGPAVAADGGAAGAGPEGDSDDGDGTAADRDRDRRRADGQAPDQNQDQDQDQDLSDVDHTPPRDAEDANRVHERGGEGRTENV